MGRPFKYKAGFGHCSRKLVPGKGFQIVEQHIPVDWELAYPEKSDFVIAALATALTGAGDIESPNIFDAGTGKILKEIEQALHYNRFAIQNADIKIYAAFQPALQTIEAIKNNIAEQLFIKIDQINVAFYDAQLTDDVVEEMITARVIVLLSAK